MGGASDGTAGAGTGRLLIAQAAVEAIPFVAGSFERVLTVNTLYFWADPQRGLREILRVLAPGAAC